MEPVDRLVGEVVLEVVLLALLGLGDADHLLVLGDQGVVLSGLTAEEAPEIVESEPRRPAVERPGEALLVVRGQMPLPEPSRQVAVLLEDARKRRAIAGNGRVVPRERPGELAHHAEADPMMVTPRHQGGPRGRTKRRDVEAVVAQPVLREPRVIRRLDRTAERARIAEARVVDQHEQNVRRTLRWRDVRRLIPVRRRLFESLLRDAAKRRTPNRQAAAVNRRVTIRCVSHWFSPLQVFPTASETVDDSL